MNCAPEFFQQVGQSLLQDIPNCVNFIDDTLIWAKTEQVHDDILSKVLRSFDAAEVLLNTKKCQFKKLQVTFLGHVLSAEGIRPTEDKLQAIKAFCAPKSKEEVRSFLGLANYVSKFIPGFATLSEPLRELTRNSAKFSWSANHEQAFQQIKLAMLNPQTLAYYDMNKPTRVIADASPVGLGAVLVQYHGSEARIVTYAAKSLSDVERRYSQTEKEALALVWAVERFATFLIGTQY